MSYRGARASARAPTPPAVASHGRPTPRARRRLRASARLGLPDPRPLLARAGRGGRPLGGGSRGHVALRRTSRPVERPGVLPAHPLVVGHLRRQPAVGGPEHPAGAVHRRDGRPHRGDPASAARHPPRAPGVCRGARPVGAAGDRALPHAVRGLPLGQARLQPGRQPAGPPRRVRRGAGCHLRRRCSRSSASRRRRPGAPRPHASRGSGVGGRRRPPAPTGTRPGRRAGGAGSAACGGLPRGAAADRRPHGRCHVRPGQRPPSRAGLQRRAAPGPRQPRPADPPGCCRPAAATEPGRVARERLGHRPAAQPRRRRPPSAAPSRGPVRRFSSGPSCASPLR